jgi:hypothetical protein
VKLPVVDAATRACASCHGPCCFEHVVPISGYDLWRLARGLGVPWEALADTGVHRVPLFAGFRLDRGPDHHFFQLRRRASGACQLLVELESGHRRCGAHGLRPGACRLYPLVPDRELGAALGEHAVCPDEPRAIYQGAAGELRALVDEDGADRQLDARARARWDVLARRVPVEAPLAVARYVEWTAHLYEAIERLRTVERGDWQLAAYALVDKFPLPEA